MPLYSEHISNMYYGGSPSYTSPSYGYKSSYNPLGTSYSASYLSPGGSYSNHSSLSSYSRAPLSSRWIPGLTRSYSPMLTPISERGTASPIRINSPRRIPISKRCYGTPSYIQRPININTESIDVSRDRYRPKPAEVAQPSIASLPRPQNDDPVKDNENNPFMPRIDGKPETGIDSSPGIQRSTIKRGRTVVRLHTIKRKDKDSPRKSIETSQLDGSDINEQVASEALVDDIISEEPKESLRWREKLSEDLVYVDKKEKKSLGTKLVEKFLVKDVIERDSKVDKSDIKTSEGISRTFAEVLPLSCEVPLTSKSPDRRCSVELLAEQSSLLDSLIRGENLSTATLDLSKVGIADETKNKHVSSNSIKRRKTDDNGNPLKTTKSDHSLHDNLSKSLKGNKDSKTFTKRRSLKKSQSGGSICRLDSITEFPKEPIDLPAIQENKFSPKQTKTEQKPNLRTKITASVEISPPSSPLKFRIENVTVEEKHHTPKKEISFSYDVDEIPTQDVTLQGPKTTLRRTKERNSVKKKSKKNMASDSISPETDDGNFWAKIGKRETVYLIKRKQNIEAAREENKRAYFWIDGEEESGDVSNSQKNPNVSIDASNNVAVNKLADSELPHESEPNILLSNANVGDKKEGHLKNNSTELEKSKSLDSMQKVIANSHSSSLKEEATIHITEPNQDDLVFASNETSMKQILRQDVEIKKDATLSSEEKKETRKTTDSNLSLSKPEAEKSALTNLIKTNMEIPETALSEKSKIFSPAPKTVSFDEATSANTDLDRDLKQNSEISGVNESSKSKIALTPSVEVLAQSKTTFKTQDESDQKSFENNLKPTSNIIIDTIEITKANFDLNLTPETLSQSDTIPVTKALILKNQEKSNEKDSKPISEKIETITAKINIDANYSTKTSIEKKTKPVNKALPSQFQTKNEDIHLQKDSKTLLLEKTETIGNAKAEVDVNLLSETANTETKPYNIASTLQTQVKSDDNDLKPQLQTSEAIQGSNSDPKLPTETKSKPVITIKTLQSQAKSEIKSLDKDSTPISEKLDTIDKGKTNTDADSSNQTSADTKAKVTNTSTLQAQVKPDLEEKKLELLPKNKQTEKIKHVNSNINKQIIPESLKKTVTTDTTETSSKKKIKKVQVKIPEKDKDISIEKLSNDQKDKVCETCKKSLGSDSSKNNKLNVKRIKDPSKSKSSQGKDKVIETNSGADKSINNMKETTSNSDNTFENSSDSSSKPQTSASTSQIPIVIETKNIPNETVVSDTDKVQTSVPSQEMTGEKNKAENDTKVEENSKDKETSIKKVVKPSPKKLLKEEKPLKPLIATPRPLLKRAPQVIHSDSSDSSSEDSSEEEESQESENSGEFYECENNTDGRTSTGSNDSGFDSSAPTSPASFLHIKKDCDVNCHRKCEKLTANLCGVNQRLLVEALATRTASKKGGGDSPGPSSSNTPSQLPATDVGDSELELEQSTAYGIFRKTGRFTPPARSIPRFRKYNIEDFQFIKVLGKGSFGKVLLAELRDTEYYYAVKCLKKDVVLEDDDVECTLIERKVLALGTNHPYLCHLFATFQTDSHLFFVMEYLNGGDLMFHIQQSGRFPEARARFYAAEIVSGLKFLHKRGIVYRDLKLDNILLDFDGHVRIADFGMCKLQIYLDKTADTFCGTPDYMAPEIIKGLKYNQTVDWWSFGVLLYEMLIGQSPFSGCDEDELFWSICNEMPSYPRFLSREALTILTRLLDKDAKTRLGGTECMHGDVREQDFFHPVHWDKLERRELETPFKPRVRHPLDTQYFDRAFTGERPRLTAVEPHVLRSMDQEPFRGFSYTNPNATDR